MTVPGYALFVRYVHNVQRTTYNDNIISVKILKSKKSKDIFFIFI